MVTVGDLLIDGTNYSLLRNPKDWEGKSKDELLKALAEEWYDKWDCRDKIIAYISHKFNLSHNKVVAAVHKIWEEEHDKHKGGILIGNIIM